MAGLLGMIGIILGAFRVRLNWIVIAGCILISLFGIRTAFRGLDWENTYTLAKADIAASLSDYNAYNVVAQKLLDQSHYLQAEQYARESVEIYPTYTNYCNLGAALFYLGDYQAARAADTDGLRYGDYNLIYENLAGLALVHGSPATDGPLFEKALGKFPTDYKLWLYLALIQQEYHANAKAKIAMTDAAKYGPVPSGIYNGIMNNQAFAVQLPGLGELHFEAD
jgi:tetratricopeptide (TPR) repeat protein